MSRAPIALVVTLIVAVAAMANAFGWAPGPEASRDEAMAAIGRAAARGQGMPPEALAKLGHVARQAPLAAEPYLAMGAKAEIDGNPERAERLFLAARKRDPRAPAARYFLAQRYLATGRLDLAVDELAALSRILSATAPAMAPAFARAARMEGGERAIGRLLAIAPTFRDPLLGELAKDPSNAELLVRQSRQLPVQPGPAPGWQESIVNRLVEQRQYDRARTTWQALSGEASVADLFNPEFAPHRAPPPFNWRLSSGTIALVEPAPGGGLQVIHYGRENGLLAEQLLLLAPGRYRLRAESAGGNGASDTLNWQVACFEGDQRLMTLPVRAGIATAEFVVPSGCRAQRIALHSAAPDMAGESQWTLRPLQLTRIGR